MFDISIDYSRAMLRRAGRRVMTPVKCSSVLLAALLVSLVLAVPAISPRASAAPTALEAYLAVEIPAMGTDPCRGGPGAWTDAPRYEEPVTGATVAFKHDGSYLYLSAEWPDASPSYWDYFGVEFDNDGDGAHMGTPSSPDDALFLSPSFQAPTSGCARDAFVTGFASPTFDVDAGGANDLAGRMVRLNGTYFVEVRKPFASNDTTGKDLAIARGMSVGIGLVVGTFGGGANHRATDLSSYVLVLTEKQSAIAPQIRLTNPVVLAYDLGLVLLLSTGALIAFHFVRRRAWRAMPVFGAAKGPAPYVLVRRHALSIRAIHWTHAALMVTLLVTGIGIYWKFYPLGAATTWFHVGVGLTILTLDIPVRTIVLWRARELGILARPLKEDVRQIGGITKNLFGLSKKYPEHSTFDPRTRRYFMDRKYCSFQKAMLWGDLFGIVAVAITGMALYTSSFGWVVDLLGGSLNVRAVHLLLFFYFAATIMGHVYLSVIPYNWGKLRAMTNGVGRVREHVPAATKTPAKASAEAPVRPRGREA